MKPNEQNEKPKRVDIGKLKSKYYDGDADYTTDFELTDVQRNLSIALNEEALLEIEDNYSEIEIEITEYIRGTQYGKCNNATDKNSIKVSVNELAGFFIKLYEKYSKECSLSLLIIIFGDYFGIDYLNLIRELPNFMQETLYHDTYSCVKDKTLLNEFFANDVDMTTAKKLF